MDILGLLAGDNLFARKFDEVEDSAILDMLEAGLGIKPKLSRSQASLVS